MHNQTISDEIIISKIFEIRGIKVMLDRDLAELYGVETKQLKRQVKRNSSRFPDDFMFEITQEEFNDLRRQIGTSTWGGTRYSPMAFTEQGVAMHSGVLNSKRAIAVNIQIMRTYTKMREAILIHKDLLLRLEEMDKKVSGQDERIQLILKLSQRIHRPKRTTTSTHWL